jgi:hypothetical protein
MLKELLQDSVNRVEIYLTPSQNPIQQDGIYREYNVGWNSDTLAYKARNLKIFGTPFETTSYELVSEDIIYSYDLATDGQRAIRKVWKTDQHKAFMYAVGFQEEVLPSHRFPSTKDISMTQTVERKQYRVNNRIQLILETFKELPNPVLYISYYHSPNVDLDKMERDLFYCLKKLKQIGICYSTA